MSKFFFLAGLHRSGNTVLSAILNQNPEIYVSPLSPMIEYIWRCHDATNGFETALANPLDKTRSDTMIKNMIGSYYSDIDKPYIIERNKSLANPGNIELIKKYIDEKPKIIVTVRPLRECVASFINVDKELLLLDMAFNNFVFDDTASENENIVNYVLSGNMVNTLFWINESLSNPEIKDMIHLVKYDDLINDPEKTLKSIYEFLDLDLFNHDFNNIQTTEKPLDEELGMSENLHKIRSVIGRSDLKVEDVLSHNSIKACDQMDLISINHIK